MSLEVQAGGLKENWRLQNNRKTGDYRIGGKREVKELQKNESYRIGEKLEIQNFFKTGDYIIRGNLMVTG